MSFHLTKAGGLQNGSQKMIDFCILSLNVQGVLSKRHSSPTLSIAEELQMFAAAVAELGVLKDDKSIIESLWVLVSWTTQAKWMGGIV